MTTPAPHISPVQYVQRADGTMALKDLPEMTLETITEQGKVIGRDWQGELGLPHYYEDYEAMARVESLSTHRVAFVLMDEAPTSLPGAPRMFPRQVTLPQTCPLELGHTGFVIGTCHAWLPAFDAGRTEMAALMTELLGFDVPGDLEGDYIVGFAQLFQSPLAERAWEGIHQDIFTHVCPNILRPHGAAAGTGSLIQVTLTPGDYPGCPHARILRAWDE